MLLTLPVAVTVGYLAVQRAVVFPDGRVPLTWFDRVIPFQSRWVWVYLSLYLLNPIGPLLARSRQDLLRYARGILFVFVCGFVCFVMFPVAGPRPAAADNFWLYQRLILIDRVYNSFPSLHAACAVYAVLFAAYASSDTSRRYLRRSLLSLAWLWVGLILYSTIATRQHFAIDLPAGVFLGWLAQWLFVSRKSRTSNSLAFVNEEVA
jgi:membrane-associated phospholipid phosphatase